MSFIKPNAEPPKGMVVYPNTRTVIYKSERFQKEHTIEYDAPWIYASIGTVWKHDDLETLSVDITNCIIQVPGKFVKLFTDGTYLITVAVTFHFKTENQT